MPFDSKRQSRFFFANPEKLGGMAKVREFAHATDYSKIPERAGNKRRMPPPRLKRK